MTEAPADLETAKTLSTAIERARTSGSYLVAVFHVTENHKLQLDRVSHNFPLVDFENCVKLLDEDLSGERDGLTQQREAMAQASPVAPVVNLFGSQPPAADDPDGST